MTEPSAPTDLDILMSRISEINAKTPPLSNSDLEALVTYYRRQRARRAVGEKPTKPSTGPKLDLDAILNLPSAKPQAKLGLRRI
jgi:hypothetical protein